MRAFLFSVIFACVPCAARASNVILMVNMNYSAEELKAAKDQAAARCPRAEDRGTDACRVEVVPPENMIPAAETLFGARERLRASIAKNFPNISDVDLQVAVGGILREGSKWSDDSGIAQFVGAQNADQLSAQAAAFAEREKRNGEMYDQLKRKAEELKAKGDRVDSVILSSHSDGSNLTGETSNRLSANEMVRLNQEEPELFGHARHVLLMGCYGMSRPHHEAWRHDLFPNASLLAGFGEKAPSRFDHTSAKFIREVLGKAQELDEQMAALGRPLNPAYLSLQFRLLDSIKTTAHPGVVDYCYNIIEGQPGAWSESCDEQWAKIFAAKEKMSAYTSQVDPKEDPPVIAGGVLRAFYNQLQDACLAVDTDSQRGDAAASERYRVTTRESLIRLLFWWNVQQNFSTYFAREIASLNDRLVDAGVAPMPTLDGSLSRVKFVNAFNDRHFELKRVDPRLRDAFDQLYLPLVSLHGEDTVIADAKDAGHPIADPGSLTVESTLARGAIPFNWIEGTTVLRRNR